MNPKAKLTQKVIAQGHDNTMWKSSLFLHSNMRRNILYLQCAGERKKYTCYTKTHGPMGALREWPGRMDACDEVTYDRFCSGRLCCYGNWYAGVVQR